MTEKKIIEEVGSFPTNARIFINHSTNPPEIKFEYPSEKPHIFQEWDESEAVVLKANISIAYNLYAKRI